MIVISAQYLPGWENIYADALPRQFGDYIEWVLKHNLFLRICKQYFCAFRINKQLKKFVSWNFDPDEYYVDAFILLWSNLSPYNFPLFYLLEG